MYPLMQSVVHVETDDSVCTLSGEWMWCNCIESETLHRKCGIVFAGEYRRFYMLIKNISAKCLNIIYFYINAYTYTCIYTKEM